MTSLSVVVSTYSGCLVRVLQSDQFQRRSARAGRQDARKAGVLPTVVSCQPLRHTFSTVAAAERIVLITAAGCEIIGTWDAATVEIFACARSAMNICVFGGIA